MHENRERLEDEAVFELDSCYGLNCVPTDPYIEVLTASTSECDCMWTQSLKEAIKVK